ncbi:MAG: pantoate--beta-alanine ligase [Prolixibacteraceae bacterium]|nr:pantoate--beta-alanine ligase [Prolixibacteraceae bacterium]
MFLVETKAELKGALEKLREGGTVGIVPTMGALHTGHISLVNRAVSENSVVVVTIFVNPAQFNDPNDLKSYPRDLDSDLKLLEQTGCQLVFAPSGEEIYPVPDTRRFDFGGLDKVMEGQYREGHFQGVGQIVSILFDLIKPDRAYFGMKDLQQLVIIKKLVNNLKLPVQIVPCETVREKNGLAMSSRNRLLSPEQRENASLIYKTLSEAGEQILNKSVSELKKWVIDTINGSSSLDVQYFEIVNFENLLPVKSWEECSEKVACIAVFCGQVRLIDNYFLS